MSCSLDVRVHPFKLQRIPNLAFFTRLCEICLQFCITNTEPEALQYVWTHAFRLSPHACATSSFESEHVGEDLKKLSPFLKVWPPPPLCMRSLRDTDRRLLFVSALIEDPASTNGAGFEVIHQRQWMKRSTELKEQLKFDIWINLPQLFLWMAIN